MLKCAQKWVLYLVCDHVLAVKWCFNRGILLCRYSGAGCEMVLKRGSNFLCDQVMAVSKPVKLTYSSWGKPAKRPSTCPAERTVRPATRQLAGVFDATVAATAGGTAAATAAARGSPEAPGLVRQLLQRSDLSRASDFKGKQVEVYWPQDDTWWLARIIKVTHLQLVMPPALPVGIGCDSQW